MREQLARREGYRFLCRAVVDRFGNRTGWKGRPVLTLLLRDVVEAKTGTVLTDHLWFTVGKWSEGLAAGDVIGFEARSGDYIKGYRGRRDVDDAPPVSRDWRLERPTKVRVLRRAGTAGPAMQALETPDSEQGALRLDGAPET